MGGDRFRKVSLARVLERHNAPMPNTGQPAIYQTPLGDHRSLDFGRVDVVETASIVVWLGGEVLPSLVSFRLRLLGYDVSVVQNGDEALAGIHQRTRRLMIVDTEPGSEDGLIWLASIRKQHPAAKLPAMVITADPSLDTVRRAYESGAQDYLIVPFDLVTFETKVDQLILAADPDFTVSPAVV